jgi:hypothetical protein
LLRRVGSGRDERLFAANLSVLLIDLRNDGGVSRLLLVGRRGFGGIGTKDPPDY